MTTENSAVVKIMAQKDREISELKRQLVSFHNKVGHLQAENLALNTLIDGQRAEFVEKLKKTRKWSAGRRYYVNEWEIKILIEELEALK